MTLQDVLKILDLNPLWKEASNDEKVTAINQFLNTTEFKTNYIMGSTGNTLSLQVDKYQNFTYRNLNNVLELNHTEEEVLALFQYSLMELAISNPLQTTFIEPIAEKVFTLDYLVKFRNSYNILGDLTFAITPKTKVQFKLQPQSTVENILNLPFNVTYNDDLVQESTKEFTLEYSAKFRVQDMNYPLTFNLDISTTYRVY